MDNLIKLLNEFGLNDKESKIYLANLELGATSVQALSRKSGVKRTSIYNFLEDLERKGFISIMETDAKTSIIPEKPETLLLRAQQQTKKIEAALPQLQSFFNLPAEKPKVRFYQGKEGIKRTYEDLLNGNPKEIYTLGDYEAMFAQMEAKKLWDVVDARVNKGIKCFCIAKAGPEAKKLIKKDAEQLRRTVLTKDPKISFETETNIAGNKVAMLSFRPPYAGIIIEDKAIANTQHAMWQMIWDRLAKT